MPGTVKALRIVNLLLAGNLTSEQLDNALSNPLAAGAFESSLRQRTVVEAIKASPNALKGICGSPIALNSVFRQALSVFDAIISTSAALGILTGSPVAMATCLANVSAIRKFYDSDTALTAIAESAIAKAAIRAAPNYRIISQVASQTPVLIGVIGPSLMVGWSMSSGGVVTLSARRVGSTVGVTSGSPGIGTTAGTDNVMAITSSITVMNNWGSQTHYFGIIQAY